MVGGRAGAHGFLLLAHLAELLEQIFVFAVHAPVVGAERHGGQLGAQVLQGIVDRARFRYDIGWAHQL